MATIPAGFQVIYNHRSHALPIPEPQDPILIVQQERFVGILDELVEAQHSLGANKIQRTSSRKLRFEKQTWIDTNLAHHKC